MNPKNVLAEFTRAQKSLQAAKLLHADGLFEDAVSRAYYAVMHSAKAALLVHDQVSESHAAIRRLFGSVLVRSGRIEKQWATILAREQDRRIAADYDATLSIDADASLPLVEDADRFVQRMRRYLVQEGVLEAGGKEGG
ncbi:MAG: HEPN domain-containing protein [Terriglobia bacterium]